MVVAVVVSVVENVSAAVVVRLVFEDSEDVSEAVVVIEDVVEILLLLAESVASSPQEHKSMDSVIISVKSFFIVSLLKMRVCSNKCFYCYTLIVHHLQLNVNS